MDATFSAEQQQLIDSVRRFCAEQITRERLLAWEREPRGVDEGTWHAIADLGWIGLGVPASADGSGLGLTDVAVLLQECGRGLVPRAVIGAIRGARALSCLDPAAVELAEIVSGATTVALALAQDPVSACVLDDGTISGETGYVAGGMDADLLVASARKGNDETLVLVEAESAERTPLRTIDGDRQAHVRYSRTPIRRILASGGAARKRLREEEQALALAEMLGGMDAVLEMTVAYVKEREQFGQKIAVFQAVQHQIADMATAYTASRHLAWQAICRMEAGTREGHELPYALAFVGQWFKRLTLTAHHLHGGAGYVVEHRLHFHAERAQALCIRYAPEGPAFAEVARQLLG